MRAAPAPAPEPNRPPATPPNGPVGPPAQDEELTVERAESILGMLASALFPEGAGDFGQLTWEGLAERDAPAASDAPEDVETRLREADLRYRTLVEQIPAVTFLAVLGEGDNEIYVSPYIENLLGFTQQEWLENPFLWYSQLHPDDRALWHDEFTRGVQTGGPFRAECRFIARDGRIVWVRGEARLVRDELQRPLFLQGVAFDITESKRTHSLELQEAVRSTGQRYRDLVEHLDAVFWEADASSGNFTFVSDGAEVILGYPPSRWLSDPDLWTTLAHPDDRAVVDRVWKEALAGGGEHEFEFRALTADRREIWMHTRLQAPVLATRERYLFGVMLDVTERKQVDQERVRLLAAAEEARQVAEAANRAKDEFLATISHELKTPLNAMIGYAQLLRAKQMPEALIDSALESIERNAQAQAKLVEDLLDVSRLITGKLHLEMSPVDLAEVVDAALDTTRLAAEGKRVTVSTELDRSGLIVAGDFSRLQQVVWNLLSNAVKFTPEGGSIDVRLVRVNGHAHVSVQDTGQGIAPEFLPHVFERFRQADNSATRRHGGLGLGLAIVRQIVELHGGIILASSEGLDCGATFTIELPLAPIAGGAGASAAVKQGPAPRSLEGVRILVVDDDRDTRQLLRTVLEQAGAEVSLASSVAEAESVARTIRPHALVSDIGMPDEDGFQLLRRLRAEGMEADSLPAVALTAYTGADHRRRAMEAGFQEHVAKPVDVQRLIDLVARLVHESAAFDRP